MHKELRKKEDQQMTSYNGIFVTDWPAHRADETLTDTFMDRLAPWHVALGGTLDDRVSATITYLAENPRQAALTGLAIVEKALDGTGLQVVSFEVVPTETFDRRYGFEPVPELLSVTETAAELGVSPQAVRQRLDSGSLRGVKAGATWVVSRAEVDRAKARAS
ncbi:MAG: helix-turn-helix domain-containing protein [Frankiaceae bacterium]